MINPNKKYWLYIEPHIYCGIKGMKMLLYNTINGECIENSSKKIITLIQSLLEKNNLGAISIEGKSLIENPYNDFITDFCQKGMGNVVDIMLMPQKPIQLMPVLNLQRDIIRLEKNNDNIIGEEFLNYLLELNLYLNGTCDLNCQYCAEYFKQNVCCIKCNENNDILNREVLSNIISQIKNAPIGKINILGGNILQLPYLNDLQEILNEFAEQVHLWIHYENIAQNEININSFKIIIPVTFPVNKSAISKCVEKMENQVHEYRFFISNTNEYKITESIIEKYDIKSYNICPFYTQENFDFFKENIFINREDIFSEKIPFRRIFAHQKLNTNLFGSLTIVSNGNAHANVHSSVLGNIKTDSILNLIDKEMKINTAWRKIRNKKPCVDCLYQYICPSPSNYETVIGKPNLCHVQP